MTKDQPDAANEPSPEYALLGFLALAPAHGYELHRQLTHELGDLWHASLGHVYNVLKRMEAQGLIAGRSAREGKHPPQRRFALTAAGHKSLDAWLAKPCANSARAIRLEFPARLFFLLKLDPKRAKALLSEQHQIMVDTVEQLRHIASDAASVTKFSRIAAELRLAQAQAILGWLEHSVAPAAGRGKR